MGPPRGLERGMGRAPFILESMASCFLRMSSSSDEICWAMVSLVPGSARKFFCKSSNFCFNSAIF
jgi:cytochrome c oxidase assembly protein Cox11